MMPSAVLTCQPSLIGLTAPITLPDFGCGFGRSSTTGLGSRFRLLLAGRYRILSLSV
eukprot:UN01508